MARKFLNGVYIKTPNIEVGHAPNADFYVSTFDTGYTGTPFLVTKDGSTQVPWAKFSPTAITFFKAPTLSLVDAADDAAAATAGIAVGQMYRTGSVVKIRVA